MDDKRLIAIGYLRVSTEEQASEGKFGLEEQKELILQYSRRNNMYILDWYIDKGVSGVKETRPAMNELLFGEVHNPPVEYVLVAKSDRIARDIKLYYYYLMLMEKKGMKLVSVTEPLVDDGTGMGNIYRSLMLFVAEQERKNITMRTRGGRLQKAKQGGYGGGRPPYGYKAFEGELVVIPHEAKIIRKIFELWEAGVGVSRIARLFNQHGIPTRSGTKWSPPTITKILGHKDFYEGKYTYGEVEAIGRYEPLLKDGVWDPRTETASAVYRARYEEPPIEGDWTVDE